MSFVSFLYCKWLVSRFVGSSNEHVGIGLSAGFAFRDPRMSRNAANAKMANQAKNR